jgi:hypothetical protein
MFACLATHALSLCPAAPLHMSCINPCQLLISSPSFVQDDNLWRETAAEKRELERLNWDMINQVRQAAEVHRQVRTWGGVSRWGGGVAGDRACREQGHLAGYNELPGWLSCLVVERLGKAMPRPAAIQASPGLQP